MTKSSSAAQKILLIANPRAGSKSLGYNWDKRIYPMLKDVLGKFDFEFTHSKNHATELTRDAIQNGYDLIVPMGGDGSINEVVNGFFEGKELLTSRTSLGILPFGSGGDFIRTAGIERDFRKAVHRLKSKERKLIDVGRIEFADPKHQTRHFINTVEIGLGYHIMKHVNAKAKFIPPLVRYVTGSFQGYLASKNTPIELTVDGSTPENINLTNLIVANGKFFGRGMKPAPKAELDDGWFDLVIIKNLTLAKFCANFYKLYLSQKNISKNIVEFKRMQQIRIRKLQATSFLGTEADGEPCGEGDQTLTLIPHAIKLAL